MWIRRPAKKISSGLKKSVPETVPVSATSETKHDITPSDRTVTGSSAASSSAGIDLRGVASISLFLLQQGPPSACMWKRRVNVIGLGKSVNHVKNIRVQLLGFADGLL